MKDILVGKKLVDGQDLSSDFQTDVILVRKIDNVLFTVETFGVTENSGTFVPQIRIKKNENEYSGWINLTLDMPVALADADIAETINLNQLSPCEVRIAFTAPNSGDPDGICDIWVSGTEI